MPVNGSNRPPWLKDRVDLVNKNVPPAWAAPAKADSNDVKTAPILKKPAVASATPKENGETTKTAKLQSKEIKVPIVVQQKKPAPPPLTKPEPMIKNTTPKMTVLREPPKPKPKEPSPDPDKTDTDSKSSKSEKSSSPEPKPFFKPPLKKVIRPPSEPKERSTSPEPKGFRVQLRKVPSNLKAPRVKEKLPEVQLKKVEKPLLEDIPKKEEAYPHKPSALRSESSKRSE
ncbi:hypothetical protein pipiens_007537 [Culex pipiens pipiens]|uniref:Uncharacterized protein n=1 Tax=Culex pipiens pipiens TaxID=38569 RepID=A0ABD1DKZ1_CULPP